SASSMRVFIVVRMSVLAGLRRRHPCQRKPRVHFRAPSRPRYPFNPPPDQRRPLLHSQHPQARPRFLPVPQRARIKPHPVVAHREVQRLPLRLQPHLHRCRPCVPHHVRQRFLRHPETRRLQRRFQLPVEFAAVEPDAQSRPPRLLVRVPPQRRAQSQIIQHRWPQVQRQRAHLPQCPVHQPDAVQQPRRKLRRIRLPLHRLQIDLQRRQRLPDLVMQFPRNVPPLRLLQFQQPVRQRLQLLRRPPQRHLTQLPLAQVLQRANDRRPAIQLHPDPLRLDRHPLPVLTNSMPLEPQPRPALRQPLLHQLARPRPVLLRNQPVNRLQSQRLRRRVTKNLRETRIHVSQLFILQRENAHQRLFADRPERRLALLQRLLRQLRLRYIHVHSHHPRRLPAFTVKCARHRPQPPYRPVRTDDPKLTIVRHPVRHRLLPLSHRPGAVIRMHQLAPIVECPSKPARLHSIQPFQCRRPDHPPRVRLPFEDPDPARRLRHVEPLLVLMQCPLRPPPPRHQRRRHPQTRRARQPVRQIPAPIHFPLPANTRYQENTANARDHKRIPRPAFPECQEHRRQIEPAHPRLQGRPHIPRKQPGSNDQRGENNHDISVNESNEDYHHPPTNPIPKWLTRFCGWVVTPRVLKTPLHA